MTTTLNRTARRGACGLGILVVAGLLAALPAGAVPTWTSPITTLADGDPGPLDVEVAVDAAGNAAAVWVLDGDTETSIKASTHPVGGGWSAPVDIATPGDIDNDVELATSSASGLSVAVWSQIVGGHDVIHAASRLPGGAWSAPVPLSESDHDAIDPQVGLDALGGGVVTWRDGDGLIGLRYATRSATGVWSAPDDLAETSDGGTGDGYELAVDRSGNAIVAWEFFVTALARREIQGSFRPAGGAFSDAETLSAATVDTWDPRVAVNAAGVATVAWQEASGGPMEIKSRTREAGGAWSAIQDVSDDHSNLEQVVVVDAAGTTTAVWRQQESSQPRRVLYSTRPAGGDWDAPQPITSLTSGFDEPSLAIDASGRMTATFIAFGAGGDDIVARTRAPGGAWTDHGPVSELSDAQADAPKVAMDDDGQAVVAWVASTTTDLAQVRALDTTGPLSAGASIPATATVGQPASFAWSAVDAWSAVSSVSWTFGDGSTLSGASIAKTYLSTGTYAVSVTATDAVGNATTLTGSITVTPAPTAPPPAGVVKPTLTGVKLTKKTIHVVASDERPRATKVKLTLNTDARVVVKLKRTKKVDGKAVNAKTAKAFHAGKRAIRLSSKVGGKKLPPGIYQVTVRARNATGFSATKTLRLTIVK